jgi:hypothetical protein
MADPITFVPVVGFCDMLANGVFSVNDRLIGTHRNLPTGSVIERNAPDLSMDADRGQEPDANAPKSGHLDRLAGCLPAVE